MFLLILLYYTMIKYELENEKLKYVRTLRKARHDF